MGRLFYSENDQTTARRTFRVWIAWNEGIGTS